MNKKVHVKFGLEVGVLMATVADVVYEQEAWNPDSPRVTLGKLIEVEYKDRRNTGILYRSFDDLTVEEKALMNFEAYPQLRDLRGLMARAVAQEKLHEFDGIPNLGLANIDHDVEFIYPEGLNRRKMLMPNLTVLRRAYDDIRDDGAAHPADIRRLDQPATYVPERLRDMRYPQNFAYRFKEMPVAK